MLSSAILHARRHVVALVALSMLAAAACADEGTDPEPEPEVATIRVTVGTTTIDVPHPTGTYTRIPLRVNQVNQISFRFLGANGQDEPIIVAERADMVLDLINLAAGWTFAATDGMGATFTGNLTPTTTGNFIPRIILENTEHDHREIDRIIEVTVTP